MSAERTDGLGRRGSLVMPSALAVLALALVCYQIGLQDLWYDEAVSLRFATGDLATMAGEILGRDTNGILYYGALRAWVSLAGSSEAAARSLSALCAVATVLVGYWIATRVGGAKTAFFAGLLLATSTMFVAYGQEARMYALAMLMTTASTGLLVLAAERRDLRLFTLSGIFAGLAIYTHLFAGATLLAQAAWLIWRLRRGSLDRREVAAALGLAVLVAAPLLPLLGRNSMLAWVPAASWDLLVATFLQLSGSSAPILVAATVLLTAGAAQSWRRRNTPGGETIVLVVLVALVPLLAGIAVSPVHSVLVPRFYLIALTPICIVIAWMVGRSPRPIGAGIAVVLLGLNVAALASWYTTPTKYDWSILVAALASQTRPFDGLLASPSEALPMEYYARRLDDQVPPITQASEVARVLEDRPRRIWVVFPRWAEPDATASLQAAGYRPSGRDQLYGDVRIRAYVDPTP